VVVIGDVLLDVDVLGRADRLSPDAPVPVITEVHERRRPGGAALAALLLARTHPHVVLVAPCASDAGGQEARDLLPGRIEVVPVPWAGSTPVKTRMMANGQPVARLDRGGSPGRIGPVPAAARAAIDAAAVVLVADYAVGAAADPGLRDLVRRRGDAPLVWDPHPRGATPVEAARLVTPNEHEAAQAAPTVTGSGLAAASRRAAHLVGAWSAAGVAVTLGAQGALLSVGDGAPLVVPAPTVAALDTCGAGDAFAAAVSGALADGALSSEAVEIAVRFAADFVASGGASAIGQPPTPSVDPTRRAATDVVARVRSRGGRLVATGGCFDLLHAGHVTTLEAARRLGDGLVVCVNSDASVRRLKGAGRPLQPQADRVRVLSALTCVDAVVVFEEDTPELVLDRLRPDLWVKGGDYAGATLPEAAVLARWGGEAVALPYLTGRSTTHLVAAASRPSRSERRPDR
jgi:rfaE bifunctional protein nucleotidyltransferase chain/domain/rfaE bifunctional protein kinase chain/domain